MYYVSLLQKSKSIFVLSLFIIIVDTFYCESIHLKYLLIIIFIIIIVRYTYAYNVIWLYIFLKYYSNYDCSRNVKLQVTKIYYILL